MWKDPDDDSAGLLDGDFIFDSEGLLDPTLKPNGVPMLARIPGFLALTLIGTGWLLIWAPALVGVPVNMAHAFEIGFITVPFFLLFAWGLALLAGRVEP